MSWWCRVSVNKSLAFTLLPAHDFVNFEPSAPLSCPPSKSNLLNDATPHEAAIPSPWTESCPPLYFPWAKGTNSTFFRCGHKNWTLCSKCGEHTSVLNTNKRYFLVLNTVSWWCKRHTLPRFFWIFLAAANSTLLTIVLENCQWQPQSLFSKLQPSVLSLAPHKHGLV